MAKIGRPEVIREVISGVRPDSVMVMIAVTPCRWFAAYMDDIAIAQCRCRINNATAWQSRFLF